MRDRCRPTVDFPAQGGPATATKRRVLVRTKPIERRHHHRRTMDFRTHFDFDELAERTTHACPLFGT